MSQEAVFFDYSDWMNNPLEGTDFWPSAACQSSENLDAFYSPDHFERKPEKDEREAIAREFCSHCSVLADCLRYAIKHKEVKGIWGGMNESERGRLRAELREVGVIQ